MVVIHRFWLLALFSHLLLLENYNICVAVLAASNDTEQYDTLLHRQKRPQPAKDPTIPSPYPVTFQIQFQTNISNSNAGISMENYPINGTLYYDWRQHAQRIDHAAGSYECVNFYQTEGECSLLFLSDGMYRIVAANESSRPSDASINCCLDLPNIGTPPPEWAAQAPSTFKGWVWDEFNRVLAKEWWFDKFDEQKAGAWPFNHLQGNKSSTLPFHTTREVAAGQSLPEGFPVIFTFPGKADGRQDIHYLPHTMKKNLPSDHSLFRLPEGCQHRLCSSLPYAASVRF
ncbi:hypothetical protein IV203_018661 [Nitzschia inconspicua]|uniref:Uncharacterized protein n=1 Tax=Nitzschia inconspicua TaxID=303405 RepID=A0A9K3M1J7_9STRA|nr:hypothetical protein IV203_018661 [Nitzschia inconspicua]